MGLLSSVLLPNPKLRRETQIRLEGEIPSPIDLPTGLLSCQPLPFGPGALPASDAAGGDAWVPGHLVRCYRHDEVAAARARRSTTSRASRSEAERILGAGMPPRETRASVQ